MKAPTKFTFKTEKATGRYRSFFEDTNLIKLGGKHCGYFHKRDGKYRIQLRVKCDGPNHWRFMTLKAAFETLPEAKTWLNENFAGVTSCWTIYLFGE